MIPPNSLAGSFGRAAATVAIAVTGILAVPAAHASIVVPAASQVSAKSWHFRDSYPNRAFCNSAAEQIKRDNPHIYPQCRGPYAGGWFQLWLYY
ncbi:hypothetical protein ACFYY8_17205 [Streptosporangium sp. NPDC001559]|uniref:hypothetical protein n=1 Tax=Streptosporangium sp. NPDC001559 TaxID=3366187 RepID=UPI0036E65528